jgi:hypothetical protein
LEKLDPEGVKKARSLMAFGFLARARSGDNTSAGAQRPETNAVASTDASTPPDVARTGFEASAADLVENESEASDIPAPDGYGDSSGVVEPDDGEQDEEVDAAAVVVAEPEDAADGATASAGYSRSLVIGVPLGAALVLMAIYWLILRWGAV